VADSERFTCTRCNSETTPGTQFLGVSNGHPYRVHQCPSCGHVEVRRIADRTEGESDVTRGADRPDAPPDGETESK
jgi:hypothetical protein